jgi:uncharacterized small protein (DUF1192 family)
MALFDDERPKPKRAHEIGQDISLLSVGDLDERIGILRAEISRLESDKASKQATRMAADSLFKLG